jgi:hypothetical protein
MFKKGDRLKTLSAKESEERCGGAGPSFRSMEKNGVVFDHYLNSDPKFCYVYYWEAYQKTNVEPTLRYQVWAADFKKAYKPTILI